MAERLCFVIGPIGDVGSPTRKHADMLLNAIIKPTVTLLGYRVKRADEDPTPGMISDAVIIDLRDADLVIADLSELNANAFYELGIRHARMKPTIHVAVEGLRLPFDNAGYRALRFDLSDWASQERARAELQAMIKATEQPGFKVTNPITHANAMFELRETSDPQASLIQDVLSRIAALERPSASQPSLLGHNQDFLDVADKLQRLLKQNPSYNKPAFVRDFFASFGIKDVDYNFHPGSRTLTLSNEIGGVAFEVA
jgi:hypothetical protein